MEEFVQVVEVNDDVDVILTPATTESTPAEETPSLPKTTSNLSDLDGPAAVVGILSLIGALTTAKVLLTPVWNAGKKGLKKLGKKTVKFMANIVGKHGYTVVPTEEVTEMEAEMEEEPESEE